MKSYRRNDENDDAKGEDDDDEEDREWNPTKITDKIEFHPSVKICSV